MPNIGTASWLFWALMSAIFAALTTILAKYGVEGIDSDVATFVRTIVIVVVLDIFLTVTGKLHGPSSMTMRSFVFLGLSGLATGASWLCYFRALRVGDASRVAPVDKLSLVMVAILATLLLGERLPALGWIGVLLVAIGSICVAMA